MASPDFERVRSVLSAALTLPANQRAGFVKSECGSDEALLREVEGLLDLEPGHFLEVPAPELLGARYHPADPLPIDTVLNDRYRVEGVLEESGFATVYLARDQNLDDKLVVIKVLDRVSDKVAVQFAFQAELRSLARVNRHDVVGVSDAGSLNDGVPFLVLTYVPGTNLRRAVGKSGLAPERARRLIKNIGAALDAAHSVGVIHLDIKPENIILTDPGDDERITIVDFGCARLEGRQSSSLKADSCRYAAPEQQVAPTAQSDLYSLALVAFELFTGTLPNPALPLVSQLPQHIGKRTARAIGKALAPDPKGRFSTVAEFVAEISRDGSRSRPRFLWYAALLALAGVAAVLLTRVPAPVPLPHSTPLRFATSADGEYRPAFSPDGRWLFYAAGAPEHLDIFRKSVDGGEPVRIIDHPDSDDEPQISPDGKTLAFLRKSPSIHIALLHGVDPGGVETELGRAVEFSSLSWSADSQMLAVAEFHGSSGGTKLRRVQRATRVWNDLVPPAPASLGDDNPAISPDGRQLAFVRKWTQGSADLFVVDIDASLNMTGPLRQLTTDRQRIDGIQWTPDGRDIVYLAGPLGNGTLQRIRLSDGSRQPLLPDLSRFEAIAIPRHAWKLAWSVYLSDSNIWRLRLRPNQPASAEQVVIGTYNDEEPQLSPDGTRLAFVSERSGEEQVWIAEPDGRHPRRITSFKSPDSLALLWTADARELIISVRSMELGQRIYKTPATGPPVLQELMRDAAATSLSRDGLSLYVVRRVNGERQIWRTDYPACKKMETVVPGEARVAKESPDGKTLFYTKRTEKEGVWSWRLPDGPGDRVVERIYRRNLFVPGAAHLYYIAEIPDSKGRLGLFTRNYRSGAASQLHTFANDIFWGMDLAEEERSLLYSQLDADNVDIMLIENFR